MNIFLKMPIIYRCTFTSGLVNESTRSTDICNSTPFSSLNHVGNAFGLKFTLFLSDSLGIQLEQRSAVRWVLSPLLYKQLGHPKLSWGFMKAYMVLTFAHYPSLTKEEIFAKK